MNGDHSIDCEILNAIEQGTLSAQETRRRLEELIDAEIQKTDAPANAQLIDSCEKLLWELGTHGRLPFESRLEKNRRAVTRRFRRSNRLKHFTKYPLRVAAVTAAMLVLIVVGEAVLRREWFMNWSTDEADLYFFEGETHDPNLIEEAYADKSQNTDTFTTTNYSEATSFLGLTPALPQLSIPNWIIDNYTCSRWRNRYSLVASYRNQNDSEKILSIRVIDYMDLQDAITSFEQNDAGSSFNISEKKIHYSYNYDNIIITWRDNKVIYSLSGPITLDESKSIVEMLIDGGEYHENQ